MSFLALTKTCLRSITPHSLRPAVVMAEQFTRSFSTTDPLETPGEKKHKRPTPAFQRFRQDYADKVRSENPNLRDQDIRKLLSERWASLDPNIKEYYRKEYQQQLNEFKAPYKKLPRKPPCNFSLFMKENFGGIKEQNVDMSNSDIMRELGARWRNLSWPEKEEIRVKSEEAKKQYETDVIEFEDQLTEHEKDFLNHQAKDKMKELHQKKRKLLNFPRKPGPAFIFFLNMERDSFPRGEGEGVTEWAQRMGEKWRGMEDEEKEIYRMAWRGAKEKYQGDVAQWKEKHENK